MARAKRGVRSQAIREYLSKNPKAGPKQVVEALKEKGVVVKLGLVSAVKYGTGKRSKSRRGRSPSVRVAARRTRGVPPVTVEQLIEVKRLAVAIGGVEQVRRVLETLEMLR